MEKYEFEMCKKLKFLICIFIIFLSIQTAYSQAVETIISQEPEILKEKTENSIADKSKENNTFIQVKPQKEPEEIRLQIEENIFNKNFEKKFDTGVIKDIKLIGSQDFIFSSIRQSNGISHSVSNNETGLWGFKGHFRDKSDTMFYLTAMPYFNSQGYENAANKLFEYYIRRPLDEHHTLTVGQQRTPNTFEGSRSIFGMPVGRRAQFASKYSNITSIGAQVAGNWDKIEYRAGVFDTGRFLKNTFESPPEFAGLVSFKPIKNTQKYGKLKFGGSFNSGKREYSYNVYAAHLVYDYKRYHFDSEYAYANGYSGHTISSNKSYGYHTTFLYDISPKIQAFCRLDTLNANTSLNGQISTEYTAGMHYYLKGRKARLTLSYIHNNNDIKNDSNRLFSMLELLL